MKSPIAGVCSTGGAMSKRKRKFPNGADNWESAKQQADAYHRKWLEAYAANPDPAPSAEELENHEFVLA